MEIVNVVRFKVSPDQEQEMRARRTALIEAKAAFALVEYPDRTTARIAP